MICKNCGREMPNGAQICQMCGFDNSQAVNRPKGQSFSVYSYDGYWFCIDYNGRIGYVSHKMVTGG